MILHFKLPIFHGTRENDVEQHWFTFEAIWEVKKIVNENAKIVHLESMFRERDLMWYMNYKMTTPTGENKFLMEIKVCTT